MAEMEEKAQCVELDELLEKREEAFKLNQRHYGHIEDRSRKGRNLT